MSSGYDNMATPTLLIKFSNSRRRIVENQQKLYKAKSLSLLEIFVYNFIPSALASTLLAPLNRIRIIQQVQNFNPERKEQLNLSNIIKSIFRKI